MRKGPWSIEIDFCDTHGWQVISIDHRDLGDMDLVDEHEAPLSKVAFDAMVVLRESRSDRKKDIANAARTWLALAADSGILR